MLKVIFSGIKSTGGIYGRPNINDLHDEAAGSNIVPAIGARLASGPMNHYISDNEIKREAHMAEVRWLTNVDEGLRRAKDEKKPILLDFFNPG